MRDRKQEGRPRSRMAELLRKHRDEQARMFFHEAGHAVVYHALKAEVARIVTKPQPLTLVCRPAANDSCDLVAVVAGYLAERRAFPQERSLALAGAVEDLALVAEIVKECLSVERQLKVLMLRAGRILRANWSVVQQLAGLLSKTKRRLEGAPLQEVLAGVSWQPRH